MNIIIIGNVISFIGALLMISIGLIKNKKNILAAQCLQFGLMGVGNLVLGGVTGFISNIIGLIRNLICYKREFTLPLKIFFIVIQVALSAWVNKMGLIGWFPIIATILFTWFLDTKSEIVLKEVIIVCQILWIIYDFELKNFSAFTFDILTVISTVIGIFMILKSRKEGN